MVPSGRPSSRIAKYSIFVLAILFTSAFATVASATLVASTPAITVTTDKSDYTTGDKLIVSGTVSPIMGENVTVSIKNPHGTLVAATNSSIDEDNGEFGASFVTGGRGWEISGVYSVTADWRYGFSQLLVSKSVTFRYFAASVPPATLSKTGAGTIPAGSTSGGSALGPGPQEAQVTVYAILGDGISGGALVVLALAWWRRVKGRGHVIPRRVFGATALVLLVSISYFSGVIVLRERSAGVGTGCSLQQVATVALHNISGRIDHMAADPVTRRLFVAGLGNNSLIVVDLGSATLSHAIVGLDAPRGVGFVPQANRIFVSNGGDGTVDVFDANSFTRLETIQLASDADNIRYDAASGLVYVGYGSGGLAAVNASSGEVAANFPLPSHPESFAIDSPGSRIFANLPSLNAVAVIDTRRQAVASFWTLGNASENFPMAIDQAHHRLFIGTRNPPILQVLDTSTGNLRASVEIGGDADDIFYDAVRGCLYVSAGQGFINIIRQVDPDNYQTVATISTFQGARTSLYVPSLGELLVAVPRTSNSDAQVLLYQSAPK